MKKTRENQKERFKKADYVRKQEAYIMEKEQAPESAIRLLWRKNAKLSSKMKGLYF